MPRNAKALKCTILADEGIAQPLLIYALLSISLAFALSLEKISFNYEGQIKK